MTSTTPDDARRILAGVEKGDGFSLHGEWCDALKALAADNVEWAVMLTYGREDYIDEDWWYPTEYEAREALGSAKRGTPHLSPRLVARRVSAPWEVTDGDL